MSSFALLPPPPCNCVCGGGGCEASIFKLANPFIKSSEAPAAGAAEAPPEDPKIPIRSSIPAPIGSLVVGLATRMGVPASPSSPDEPPGGAFCILAGAAPSKSISRRFSAWFCTVLPPPETAAAAAAAAKGFSRAFWAASSMAACCRALADERP
jgi:hypothetical protein